MTGVPAPAATSRFRAGVVLLTALLTACDPASPVAPIPSPVEVVTPPTPTPVPTVPLVWMAATASPSTLYEGQGAAVEGRLYVFGGFFENRNRQPMATRAVRVYDPANDQWTTLRDAPDAVTHAGVAVDGTNIYVAGGFLGDHPGPQTDHVWRYDTRTDTWTALPPLPSGRGAGVLVRLGRDLHYFGGTERNEDGIDRWDNSDHWKLSLDTPIGWHALAPLPNARNHLGAAVLDGQIYAIGGQHLANEAHGNLTDVDRYDPATNTWLPVAPLPLPLGHLTSSTVVWDARIVVIGGVTQATRTGAREGQESDVVLAYDPVQDQWSPLTPLPGPRQSPIADTIDGMLVVTTGSTEVGPVDTTVIGH
ncbi:Kelch repeat-containing protein [Deinococcus yunweiensis]|uniref:Kelch repeat-containing protein n=1 Tax=Deinococcus yunweiensis TaxID=367282 RepID=UPI00398F6C1F